ncbi:MAG: PfkB family carbohydrate kinase, partial [Rubrivivax sp.]
NLSGSSQFDRFNFVGGGTLNNNGTLVVTGPTNWAGSTLTGSGNTRLEGPLRLASSGITISAGTLVLAGTTTQTGTGGINTNGAGDTLHGALLLALAEGLPPSEALHFGAAAAACSVTGRPYTRVQAMSLLA